MDLLGQAGAIMEPDSIPAQGWFQEALLYAPGMRVLGLPADVRVDKDLPFSELPKGAAK